VNARVFGDAWEISPLQIQGSRHFLYTCSADRISIGCETRTVAHWLRNYRKIGKANGYSEKEIQEYKVFLDVAAQWLEDHVIEVTACAECEAILKDGEECSHCK
jgi:hypothetical protein